MFELTDEQVEELKKAIEDGLVERWKQHALVSDIDYTFGALKVMSIISGSAKNNQVWGPGAGWTMLALAQRSIVASVLNQRDEEEMAKTAQAREDEFVRWYHKREELVKFVQLVYRKTHPRNYASDERRAIREHAAMLLEDLDLWPPEDMEV